MEPTDYKTFDNFIKKLTVDDFLQSYGDVINSISKIKIDNFATWQAGEKYTSGQKRIYKGENNYYDRLLYECTKDIQGSTSNPALDSEHWKVDVFFLQNKQYFVPKSIIEKMLNGISQMVPAWVKTSWRGYENVCAELVFSLLMYKVTSRMENISIGYITSQSAIDLSQSLQIPSWLEGSPNMLLFSQNPFGRRCLLLAMQYAPVQTVEVYRNDPDFSY